MKKKKFTLNTHVLIVEGKKRLRPTGSLPISQLLEMPESVLNFETGKMTKPKKKKKLKVEEYPIVSYNLYGSTEDILKQVIKNSSAALVLAELDDPKKDFPKTRYE